MEKKSNKVMKGETLQVPECKIIREVDQATTIIFIFMVTKCVRKGCLKVFNMTIQYLDLKMNP